MLKISKPINICQKRSEVNLYFWFYRVICAKTVFSVCTIIKRRKMSQRAKPSPKPSPSNTLFKYFSKTPKTPQNDEEKPKVRKEEKITLSKKELDFGEIPITIIIPITKFIGSGLTIFSGKRAQDSSDDEQTPVKPSKKRRILDSDDDAENTNSNSIEAKPEKTKKRTLQNEEDSITKSQITPKSKLPKYEHNKKKNDDEDEMGISDNTGKDALLAVDNVNKLWAHEKHDFLKPEKIRDLNKNRPNQAEYDSRTLFVPDDFLKQQTPAHAQWWKLKSQHYDCVFFFKVGKFYELFHQDAIVGVKELNCAFMKGDYAHSGFPETAYEKMSSILIEKGYKVARIEQTETPAMMEERCKRDGVNGKHDKVMRREICQVSSQALQSYATGQQSIISSFNPNYILSVAEHKSKTSNRFGICFVDTTIGDFTLGEFDDDSQASRLLTLLSHYTPALVLFERNGNSQSVTKIIKNINALKEPLTNEKQFWNGSKALKFLSENIFKSNDQWPECLKEMQGDHLKPAEGSTMALKALGGCLWYLQHHLLDKHVLSLASFKVYTPPDESTKVTSADNRRIRSSQKSMVLDSITLCNLNIFGKEHSLFSTLDYCCTQFGKRLLMEWLCSPTCDVSEIRGRQEGIVELFSNTEILQNCRVLLSTLNVDLERSLAQIHQLGNKELMHDHPSSRAILYEMETYGKTKINDFAAALNGFDALMKIPEIFDKCESKILKQLTQPNENGGSFEDMSDDISFFKTAFDLKEALKTGFVVPANNADEEHDAKIEEIKNLETELQNYLKVIWHDRFLTLLKTILFSQIFRSKKNILAAN